MKVRYGRSSGRKVVERDWIKLFDFPISDITGVNAEFLSKRIAEARLYAPITHSAFSNKMFITYFFVQREPNQSVNHAKSNFYVPVCSYEFTTLGSFRQKRTVKSNATSILYSYSSYFFADVASR